MARVRLTDRMLRTLKTKRTQEEFYDEGFAGGSFLVRITQRGRRTFCFAYKRGRRNIRVSLGTYPALSLADARRMAQEMAAQVAQGRDPAEEKRRRQLAQIAEDAQTFAVLAKDYMQRHATPKKRESSVIEDQRIIDTYLLPVWRHTPYRSIKKADVAALLDSIAIQRKAPVMANRVHALISTILNFAVKKGLLPDDYPNPCRNIDKHKEQSRDRVLSDDEVRKLWKALERFPEPKATIYRLILATCQRGGEVKQMQWKQIEDGIWTIPAEVTKNGKEQQLPLPSAVQEWVKQLKPLAGKSKFVFPARAKSGHVTWMQKANKRLRKASGLEFTPHDLRRTGATNLARLGVDDVIIAKILNHKWADRQVTSIYNRDSRLPEVKVALERWGERLQQVVTGKKGKVVQMRA